MSNLAHANSRNRLRRHDQLLPVSFVARCPFVTGSRRLRHRRIDEDVTRANCGRTIARRRQLHAVLLVLPGAAQPASITNVRGLSSALATRRLSGRTSQGNSPAPDSSEDLKMIAYLIMTPRQ